MNPLPLKAWGLLGAAALAAFFTSFFFSRVIFTPSSSSVWLLLVSSVLFLSLFLLQGFFFTGKPALLGIAFLDAALLTVFFLGVFSQTLLVAMIIAWIFFGIALTSAERHSTSFLKIRFGTVARGIVRHASRGFALFVVVGFLGVLAAAPRDASVSALQSSVSFFSSEAPNMRISDFILTFLPKEAEKLTPAEKQEVAAQVLDQINVYTKRFENVMLSPSQTVSEGLYALTFGKLKSLSGPGYAFAVLVGGALLYFSLRFLFVFLDALSIVVSFGIFKILGIFKFYHILTVQRDQEVLSLVPPEH